MTTAPAYVAAVCNLLIVSNKKQITSTDHIMPIVDSTNTTMLNVDMRKENTDKREKIFFHKDINGHATTKAKLQSKFAKQIQQCITRRSKCTT